MFKFYTNWFTKISLNLKSLDFSSLRSFKMSASAKKAKIDTSKPNYELAEMLYGQCILFILVMLHGYEACEISNLRNC